MNTKNSYRIISLVGPKHSGKSTVGKKLAHVLNAVFLDLDNCIEDDTGKSPRTLYKEGAEYFRRAELTSLQAILEKFDDDASAIVLATGGGIIDNEEAAALLKEKTFVINLEVSTETAWQRIAETSRISGELPPFLQSGNPQETHRALHERRSSAYKKLAAHNVNANDANIEMIILQIKNILIAD
jgi:shikimate kinase